MEKSNFYTLVGYRRQHIKKMTEAMEDYVEMIARMEMESIPITVKNLSIQLNVQPSSVSKMIHRLNQDGLVDNKPYGAISLSEKGLLESTYLLWRHMILERFFKQLNHDEYSLEQVEKIEHFMDLITLQNMEKLLSSQGLDSKKNT